MANPPIFPGSTRSTWKVTRNDAAAGVVHLFTIDFATRADLVDPPNGDVVMIGRNDKVWKREGGRDVDLAGVRVAGHVPTAEAVLPPLLLPFTDHARASVELSNGKLFKYFFRFGSAVYHKDAELRPNRIDILSGGVRYRLERQTFESHNHVHQVFELHP